MGEPGRLGLYAGGGGAIELIDFVRVDHFHCICRRGRLGGFRRICARRRWRGSWRAGAGALGRWQNRPSRPRSRHRTFAPACGIERLIRGRRRRQRGRSLCRLLRDGIGRLLRRSRFARLRAGGGGWRLAFCLRLLTWARSTWALTWARGVARFLLRLRRRRGLSRRIDLLWHPYGAGIAIVIARLRRRQRQTREYPSPSYHDWQSA